MTDDPRVVENGQTIRLMSSLRRTERPSWSKNGTLVKKPTKKHYIPKYPFYYTSKELYETLADLDQPASQQDEKYVQKYATDNGIRSFSAPQKSLEKRKASPAKSPPTDEKSGHRLDKKKSFMKLNGNGQAALDRPKMSSATLQSPPKYQKIFPESVAWSLTPIPGIRVLQEKDFYRRKALDMKNTDIFFINSGLIPKYMGYVPGFKFRYGGTFANMTYNAKEIGVERSLTWGGAVSLF